MNNSVKIQKAFNAKIIMLLEIILNESNKYITKNFAPELTEGVKAGYTNYPEYAVKEMADLCAKEVTAKHPEIHCHSFREMIVMHVDEYKMQFCILEIESVTKQHKAEANSRHTATLSYKIPTVGVTPKRCYSDIAYNAEGLEYVMEQVCIHSENLDTAKQSGNRELIEVFQKELAKWESIAEIAKGLDYADIKLDKQAESDPHIAKLVEKESAILKPLYLTKRNLLDLFLLFGQQISENADAVFQMYHAKNIIDDSIIFDIYRKAIELQLEEQETFYKEKFFKKNGILKTLGYNSRMNKANTEQRIKQYKQTILDLYKHQDKIQLFINSKQLVTA